MSESLAEALPKEMARCRKLMSQYRAIGPAGTFGAMMIEDTLRRADQAVMSGDVVEMIRVYEDLKNHE